MITAPGSVMLPIAKTFVAKRLDAIRHTINSTAISMKTTDTFLFMSCFLSGFLEYTIIILGLCPKPCRSARPIVLHVFATTNTRTRAVV